MRFTHNLFLSTTHLELTVHHNGLYYIPLPIPCSVIGLQSLVAIVIYYIIINMNNALWVPLSSTQVAVYTVWIPPLILTSFLINTSQLDFYSILYYYGLYHLHPCIPWSVIGLKSLVAMVIRHCTLSSTTWINLICTSYITKGILYCVPPLICTNCITNEYCTEFHPSFAQVT